jgi:hypothetical protein
MLLMNQGKNILSESAHSLFGVMLVMYKSQILIKFSAVASGLIAFN